MSNADDIYDDESAAGWSTQLSIPFSASRPRHHSPSPLVSTTPNTNRLSRTKWRHFSHSIFSRIAFQRAPLSTFGEGNLFMSSLVPAWMSENTKWWRNVTMSMVWAGGKWKFFGIVSCGRWMIVLWTSVFSLFTMISAQTFSIIPRHPPSNHQHFTKRSPFLFWGANNFSPPFVLAPRPPPPSDIIVILTLHNKRLNVEKQWR